MVNETMSTGEDFLEHSGIILHSDEEKQALYFSDCIDSGNDFLEHHGILGQKWGKRLGPPYPLDGAAESRAEARTRRAEAREQKKAIKEEKKARKKVEEEVDRRNKILKDPAQLAKNIDLFSDEEINNALKRFELSKKVSSYAPQEEKTLSKTKQFASKSARDLYKNRKMFTNEELSIALTRLNLEHQAYDKKMSEIRRTNDILDIGTTALQKISTGLSNTINILDYGSSLRSFTSGGKKGNLSSKDAYTLWKDKNYPALNTLKMPSNDEIKKILKSYGKEGTDTEIEEFKKSFKK